MENNAAFEDGLVNKCFESIDELKKIVSGKQTLNLPKWQEVSKEPDLTPEKITEIVFEGLMKTVEDLKSCKTNKIAVLLKKNKLSNDEVVVVLALCHEIYNGKGILNIHDLARMLSNQNPVNYFEKLKLFSLSGRLIKKRIIDCEIEKPFLSEYPVFKDISLSQVARGKITGIKKQRVLKPKKKEPEKTGLSSDTLKSPKQLYDEISSLIIGQDAAKKAISTAVYNHYGRTGESEKDSGVKSGKSNIMLLGPTGCGKTYICKTLAKILDVPFVILDATSLAKTGYVGGKVEDCLENLYLASGKDMAKAEKGIVYIDEIDKLAASRDLGSVDVSGRGVQQDLLKILEANIVKQQRRGSSSYSMPEMNTGNILFIVGGAFADIKERVVNRAGKNAIGFKPGENENTLASVKPGEITLEKLIEYGMMPELLGRLPVMVQLDELSEDELVQILLNKPSGLVEEYTSVFKKNNINLVFSEDVVRKIARDAREKNVGARGLKKMMESILSPYMFEMFKKDNPPQVLEITKDKV